MKLNLSTLFQEQNKIKDIAKKKKNSELKLLELKNKVDKATKKSDAL